MSFAQSSRLGKGMDYFQRHNIPKVEQANINRRHTDFVKFVNL